MARRYSPTAAERQAREEAKAERLTELHAQLAAGVENLMQGEAWQAMLAAAARFHSYSWRNCLLILSQMPTASRVAGYRTWQGLGRQVRKGERGIAVIAPVVYRNAEEDADEGEDSPTIRGWKIEHVFDISQTDGDPLPEVEAVQIGSEAPADFWEGLATQVDAVGFVLLREPSQNPNALGSMNRATATVRVNEDLSPAEACSTLAHELAHIELGHGSQDCTDPRSRREVEAESVVYVVAMASGLDTSSYSLPYVAGWAESGKEAEVMADTADQVIETARRILGAFPPKRTGHLPAVAGETKAPHRHDVALPHRHAIAM
jgi:antirestriction protein ArdC